jgi:glycosyltransferase involved in cell wall biosynthesis
MKILLLNQAFWPDVVASAQQLTMLARRLSERGHQVTVVAGNRGYDDPKLVFKRRETWNSVEILRISSINAGKGNQWRRVLNFGSFMFMCAARLAFMPRQDVVIALTSPPLISWLGSLFVRVKGGELIFWTLDLNPDEAIAAGWLKPASPAAKFLSRLLNNSMQRTRTIIALDEFMKERIVAKGIAASKIDVIPPAPDDLMHYDAAGREEFRRVHELAGKFVVMYAGNHSPCHPLDTLLGAARELRDCEQIIFLFAGGGSELPKVKAFARAHNLGNIRCLPYQPQAALPALLSSADLHVVVMGDAFSGIVHPSKIYNILKIGAPLLFIGPEESFISRLIARNDGRSVAVSARHGECGEVAAAISELAQRRAPVGSNEIAPAQYSSEPAFTRFIAHVEAAGSGTVCLPLPLGEGRGEGLARQARNTSPGFSQLSSRATNEIFNAVDAPRNS